MRSSKGGRFSYAKKTNRGGICLEIKINKEIRNYTESMFFGLSMRQSFFAVFGVGIAVLVYFAFRSTLGTETLSWVCMLAAAPFAAMGFVSYHGMPAEKFVLVWLRSEMIEPREIRFLPTNFYYEAVKDVLAAKEKEEYKKHDEKH